MAVMLILWEGLKFLTAASGISLLPRGYEAFHLSFKEPWGRVSKMVTKSSWGDVRHSWSLCPGVWKEREVEGVSLFFFARDFRVLYVQVSDTGNLTPSFSIWIPFISSYFLITLAKTSSTILNWNSKSGNICPVSYLEGKAFNFSSLVMKLVVGLSYMSFIMFRYISYNLSKWSNTWKLLSRVWLFATPWTI